MQLPTHIECSSIFLPQETRTDTFSSSHAKFQQFFPLKISLATVAFSLDNLWNIFSADRPGWGGGWENRYFYMATPVGLVSYIIILIILLIIIIIIIALKGAIRDFLQSPLCCELSPTRKLLWRRRDCVHHIKCLSRATCHVPNGMKGQLSY